MFWIYCYFYNTNKYLFPNVKFPLLHIMMLVPIIYMTFNFIAHIDVLVMTFKLKNKQDGYILMDLPGIHKLQNFTM